MAAIDKIKNRNSYPSVLKNDADRLTTVLKKNPSLKNSAHHGSIYRIASIKSQDATDLLVAYLNGLVAMLPPSIPTEEELVKRAKIGEKKEAISYEIWEILHMIFDCTRRLSGYADPSADKKVQEVLERLEKKYHASDPDKVISRGMRIAIDNGHGEAEKGLTPWQRKNRQPLPMK